MIGTEIGSYKLVSKIGEGGMGEVYVGEHALLRRRVAVKVIHPAISDDEDIVKRFINEARACSQIGHRGIVQIFDFGTTPEGVTYMIMELLVGQALSARIRDKGQLPVSEALGIVYQIAEALGAAHTFKIVHRDLKPDNIFLVPDSEAPGGERVKILDFGIAKMLDPNAGNAHTKTGSVLGTPVYMAPEQCLASQVDHRVDIYALGCVFFQLLCGRPPFDFQGIGELIGAHVYSPPPLPSSLRREISPTIDAVILRMLAKKPEERYDSMRAFLDALGETTLNQRMSGVHEIPTLQPAERRVRATPVGGTPIMKSPPPPSEAEQRELKTSVGYLDPKLAAHVPNPTPTPAPSAPAPAAVSFEKPRKEITTLGGATGQRAAAAIPQPGAQRGSLVGTMAVAFGATAALLLGLFFMFGRHRLASDLPTTPAPTPVVQPAPVAATPDLAAADAAALPTTP